MKKRLISLLLAFSMMLTFLPAGAVSAFAEGTADDTTKGELLYGGETITGSGTYQLNGTYNQGITINTKDSVVINVTGNVTGNIPYDQESSNALISIQAGTVTFNGNDNYTVTNSQVIYNNGGKLTVEGGKYVCNASLYRKAIGFMLQDGDNLIKDVTIQTNYRAIFFGNDGKNAVIENSKIIKKGGGVEDSGAIFCWPYAGKMELNNVEVEAENGNALRAESGTIIINQGKYKSNHGAAIATEYDSEHNLDLTINGGTYQGNDYNYAVASFACNVDSGDRDCNIKIHGGTFVGGQLLRFYGSGAKTLTIDENTTFQSTGGEADAVLVGHGQLIFNSGTIEVSGGLEREAAALLTYDEGEAIVNDGTFEGAKYMTFMR